jgi:hypothetical protein
MWFVLKILVELLCLSFISIISVIFAACVAAVRKLNLQIEEGSQEPIKSNKEILQSSDQTGGIRNFVFLVSHFLQ